MLKLGQKVRVINDNAHREYDTYLDDSEQLPIGHIGTIEYVDDDFDRFRYGLDNEPTWRYDDEELEVVE